jgi:hypothetical protein
MSAKPFMIWSIAGAVGLAALVAMAEPSRDVTTLEGGLGPKVETTRL